MAHEHKTTQLYEERRFEGGDPYSRSRFSENTALLGPTEHRMKNFVEDSRKAQTLYANCEGFYSRRITDLGETDELRDFISYTLFFDESSPHLNPTQSQKVALIQNCMTQLAKRYNTLGKIHYSVVWVRYYDYQFEKKGAAPLFKVYRSINDPQRASFVDVDLNVYDGWEKYLDAAPLPKSLICVPRNGAYVFDESSDSLDLIYVFSNSFKRAFQENPSSYPKEICKPYCEVVVRPLFIRLKEAASGIEKKIIAAAAFFFSWLEENENTIRAVLSVILFCTELFLPSPEFCLHKIFSSGLMLLNAKGKVPNDFRSFIEKPLVSTSAAELKNQLVALRSQVLPSSPIVLPFFDFLLNSIPKNTPLDVVAFFIFLGHKVLAVVNYINDILKATSPHHGGDDSLRANKREAWSKEPAKVKSDNFCLEMIKALISNLGRLENCSWGRAAENACREAASSPGKVIARDSKVLQIPIDDPSFPGSLYYFSEATLPRLKKGLRPILKDFTCEALNDQMYRLLNDKEEVLGILFYVEDSLAFAYVPQKSDI